MTTTTPPAYLWAGWYVPGPLHSSKSKHHDWRIVCTADTYQECLDELLRTIRYWAPGFTAIMRRGSSPTDPTPASQSTTSSKATRQAMKGLVLSCFHPGVWLTCTNIRARLESLDVPARKNSMHVLLARLVEDGTLQRRGKTGRGRAVEYALAQGTTP